MKYLKIRQSDFRERWHRRGVHQAAKCQNEKIDFPNELLLPRRTYVPPQILLKLRVPHSDDVNSGSEAVEKAGERSRWT